MLLGPEFRWLNLAWLAPRNLFSASLDPQRTSLTIAGLLRGCIYTGEQVSSWDADFVPVVSEIDDEFKIDILGSRRKIIFVEGTESSLDKPLYSLVFPGISIVAKSSSRDVVYAVTGIRGADGLHWVHARGIVDNDRRFDEEVRSLEEKCVYALSVFSVESIYYHPEMQKRLAAKQANVTGDDADEMVNQANRAAIDAIRISIDHLSIRTAEKAVRRAYFNHIPNKADISAGADSIDVQIDVATIVAEERDRLTQELENENLESIFAFYPVRESSALNQIAHCLGFQGRNQYEKAVLNLLVERPEGGEGGEEDAITFVRSLFGSIVGDINAA